MQVTTETLNPCKVALTITVEPPKVAAAKEKAYQKFAQTLVVPGFRKGKVPLAMAKPYISPERVAQEAAEKLAEPNYKEAIAETGIEPFAQAELEYISFEDNGPFVFKAYVPLRPVVTLGPYKALALEKRRLLVSEKDVDDQIEELRLRYAEYPEVVERGAQPGDVALADLMAFVEGQETPDMAIPRTTVIEIGKNIADFDAGLTGMTAGETKTIDAVYPEDFAGDDALRGKRATFTVTIKELREKKLPELDEAFVSKVHPSAKSAEELKTALTDALEKASEQMAENELEFRLIGAIALNSQINFPEVLLRAEMQVDAQQLEEQIKRSNLSVDQYLQQSGKTREQIGQEMALNAAQRIRNSLVLAEVARAEEISIEDADVDVRIAEEAERRKTSVAAMRAFLEKNEQMTQIKDQALTRKILRHLKDLSQITERTLTSEEAEALEAEEEVEAKRDRENAAAAAGLSVKEAGEAALEATADTDADFGGAAEPLALSSAAPVRRAKRMDALETEVADEIEMEAVIEAAQGEPAAESAA